MNSIRSASSKLLSIAALLAGAALASCTPEPVAPVETAKLPKPNLLLLKCGVYASDQAITMHRSFSPVVAYLERELTTRLSRPVEVELKIFKTYDEGIEAVVTGTIDFARFGPASYILAKDRNPAIALVVMEANEGTNRSNGVIFVRKDSPIRELKDLLKKNFAFGDDNSTIGRYLAQAELVKAGVRGIDLRGYRYLGRHDKVVKAIELGDFDAGAARWGAFKNAGEKENLRVIATYENVTQPWVARAALDDGVAQALRKSLLEVKDPEVLVRLGVSGFLPSSDAEYDLVRNGMKLSEDFAAPPPPPQPQPQPAPAPARDH